jgi:hypothetical protein
MSTIFKRGLVSLARHYALNFVGEENVEHKSNELLKAKLRRASNTRIGRDMGVTPSTSLDKLPLTSYGSYRRYFESPNEGDFLYPLNDYIKATTSGTMGRPKTYMLPKTALADNMRKTGFASIFIYTHDGERSTFEMGDVVYANVPGGSHIAAYNSEIGAKQNMRFVTLCPDPNLPFQAKVDYFVDNYRKIDIAYMAVTTLLDEVFPRIGEPFFLKGFMTQDSSAGVLKEEIKKVTANYPKVTYGATETMASTFASIEHPGAFWFDWRVIYTEFIPEVEKVILNDQAALNEPPETVSIGNVEVGRRYQLVATPYKTDMTRYVMPDIFECVDKGDDVLGTNVPVFRHYSRADKILILHNFTRIIEEELLHVLKESGVDYADFTVRRELEGAKEYIGLYLEPSKEMLDEEIFRRVHTALLDYDKDWRDLTNFFNYIPLKLHLLPKGTFNKYLGQKQGMPSIDRIEMKIENFSELMRLAKGGKPRSAQTRR